MDKKTSTETTSRRSPYLCCYGAINSTVIKTALLSSVLILLVAFVVLVLIGALYARRSSIFFFVSAAVLLSAAAMLTLFYLWLNRKRTLLRMQYPSKTPGKPEISTVCGSNYYSQTPLGHKSDYPMGPYLVLTLPRTNNYRGRSGTMESESSSTTNTPRHSRQKSLRRSKNLPPLASAETLTPSLLSSCYGSIDSVV